MNFISPQVIQSKSKINYSYATIKITQSRIDKGLIAIPVELAKLFPDYNTTIQVYLDDSNELYEKNYSSYKSTTRESRIGGMLDWFKKNKIKSEDEIIIQLIDKKHFIYRLITENIFILNTKKFQVSFDNSENELQASERIACIVKWTNLNKKKVVINEYYRLINTIPNIERQYIEKHSNRAREGISNNLRLLLCDIYQGHCQACNFWFLKKDNQPYFEIHHINPLLGKNPKNIILVCANCHRQFEYANVHPKFNDEGWLIKVLFNDKEHFINQIMLQTKFDEAVKHMFLLQ